MEDLLGRFYGVTLLTSCLTWCRTRNSLDATVPLSIMLSRLFVSVNLQVLNSYALAMLTLLKWQDIFYTFIVTYYICFHTTEYSPLNFLTILISFSGLDCYVLLLLVLDFPAI